MNRNEIEAKKAYYLKSGKDALDLACQYLHDHADGWSPSHEEHYRNLLHSAEVCVIKASVLDELLK